MIKTNAHFGIMAMHNAKKKLDPKNPEPEIDTRQMTLEEILHYDKLKPPDRTDKYKTTAQQRPVLRTKPIIDIWKERE